MAKQILIIVESPNKIKKISSYLGSNYIVKASVGHIMDLAQSKEHKFGIDIENGFEPIYEINEGKESVVKDLVKAAEKADEIYIASDPDREGEAIGVNIKSQLEHLNKPIKRIIFHEITKAALNTAIANPTEFDEKLFKSQNGRRCLDRLTGFSVSPFLIKNLGKNNSAGRVQSVVLRLIVERENEIKNFKPEEFWNITAQLAKKETVDDNFTAKYIKKITNKTDADTVKHDLDKSSYTVLKIESKPKVRNPYPPFITSSLLRAAASKFGYPTKKTSSIAQKLFENGDITYIRTDSVAISPEAITSCRDWLSDNSYELPSKPNIYKDKGNSQGAHECIRPTNLSNTPSQFSATPDEEKIYELIWKRFVASQMKPALYDTTTVLIESSVGKHELRANGRVLKYKGWLAIIDDLEDKKDDEDDTNVQLPVLKEKDNLILVPPKVIAEQKFTQPPPRYSESSLVKQCETLNIGRPSTYASLMTKITDRNYVERKKNTFWGTDLGKAVVDTLVKHFPFMQYDYTADMEAQLDLIAEGKLEYVDMMEKFYTSLNKDLEKANSAAKKPTGFVCEVCSKPMLLKRSNWGTFLACTDRECESPTKSCEVNGDEIKLVDKKKFEVVVVPGVKCPICQADMHLKRNKFGGEFYGCSKYKEGCKGLSKVPVEGKICSQCNSGMTLVNYKGKSWIGCMNYPTCKNTESLPDEDGKVKKRFYKKK